MYAESYKTDERNQRKLISIKYQFSPNWSIDFTQLQSKSQPYSLHTQAESKIYISES